jgi:6,7-dimethyl-8-ribityllumazine synthase
VRSETLFARLKVQEHDKTIGTYIVWTISHQYESSMVDMNGSFNIPGIALIVRKPLRADARNGLVQYGVVIGAALSEFPPVAEVQLC